jgi:hypothetical protein
MTARPLTVIPLKCTGEPITQSKKIILMYSFFFIKQNIFVIAKTVFNFNLNILKKNYKKKLCYKKFML